MKSGFIDWTENDLHLYIFEKKAGHHALVDRSSVALDGDPDIDLLSSLSCAGCEEIFLSLPPGRLTLREKSFPFSGKEKIRETLSYELEGILLGSVSDYSIDHTVIESFDEGTQVLAVCLEKKILNNIISLFSSAGLEPKVITSLDLRLSGGRSDALLEETEPDGDARSRAAAEEMLNPSINLRQEELSYMGDIVKFVKKIRTSAVLVLILLIVLAAGSTIKLLAMKREHSSLSSELQKAYHRVFPEDKKIIDAERQLMGNMNMLIKKKAALGGVSVLDALRDIAVMKKTDITLNEFNADGKNIVMKGTAQSFEDVESLKNNLSSAYNDVKVMDTDATTDKKISFTVILREQ